MARETFGRSAARGVALFLGGFSLLNLVGGLLVDHFDQTRLWIGLRDWGAVGMLVLASATATLLAIGVSVPLSRSMRIGGLVALLLALIATLFDAATFFTLWRRGTIEPGVPIPLSLVIAACLAWIAAVTWQRQTDGHTRRPLVIAGSLVACAVMFPFAQMVCFGKTDYRRPGDVAVVFGARAYADGRPSDALADRVRTACALYHEGFVHTLIFSGGPGDGAVHETQAMRSLAVKSGVPDEAIVLDPSGINTEATVRNTVQLLRQTPTGRVLAVSHAYHLPRVKLAYQRAGMEVYTVPARETYTLRKMPLLMGREVVALWAYYLRPLAGADRV